MKSAMTVLLTCLFILMSSGMAFADVPGNEVDPYAESEQTADEPDSTAETVEVDDLPTAETAEVDEQPPIETAQVDVQPIVYQLVQPEVTQQQKTSASGYDWERDSRIYKGVGWGLFGAGLLFGGVFGGAIVGSAVVEMDRLSRDEDSGFSGKMAAGLALEIEKVFGGIIIGVGGAMVIAGASVLIAESVKFNPYRRGEIAGLEFEWSPELYVSPEFNGIGFSARF